MNKENSVVFGISEEDMNRIEAAKGDDEALSEVVQEVIEKGEQKARDVAMRNMLREARLTVMSNIVECCHDLMREGKHEEVQNILCTTVLIVRGTPVPKELLMNLVNTVNDASMKRAKDECAGSA
jgi:hypothetical protein